MPDFYGISERYWTSLEEGRRIQTKATDNYIRLIDHFSKGGQPCKSNKGDSHELRQEVSEPEGLAGAVPPPQVD
jgi:hypothetical protein